MPTRWLAVYVASLLVSCGGEGYQRLSGDTMGTQYRVLARCEKGITASRIESVLERVNKSMSTYDKDSELSKINAGPAGEWTALSRDLNHVMRAAINLGIQSEGAFDITVLPLVNAWGFGALPGEGEPTETILEEARKRVGFRKIVLEDGRLKKTADLEIDLSGIAKGFGVDAVSDDGILSLNNWRTECTTYRECNILNARDSMIPALSMTAAVLALWSTCTTGHLTKLSCRGLN